MAKLFGCDSLAPAFHEDWEQMCTLLQEQGVETSRGAVIPVVLNCFLVGHEHDKSRLFTSCLRQLLSCIEEPHIVYPHLPRFKIEFIQVNAEGLVVTPSGVALVQELLALRVRVGYLGMYSCFPQEQRDAWASLLFAVLGHPRATVRTTFPIEEVRLGQLDQSACNSLSSVLVQATNIRHFTPASSASITSAKLDLSGNTNGDDLKVLGVANPYTQLLDAIEPLEDIDLGSVHLPEGAEIRFSDDSTDVLVVKNIEGETCPVLRHDPLSTVLDILVPGYGHGMVERSSVIEKRRRMAKIDSNPVHVPAPRRRTMRLQISEPSFVIFSNDQLSQLLAHVGQCVDSLELAGKLYGSTHGYMADILGKCPNLQHLDIAMMAGTMLEDITNAYILGRGPRTLTFGSWDEEYLEDSVVKIYEKLGDPTSSMARRLEKLAMNEKRSDNRMIGAKSCEAPANALHNNMRLSYFEAYMAPSYLRECTRIMNRLYDQTHGTTFGNQAERLWMVTRPLAMQVFASHASNGTYWACHRIRPSQQRFIRRCERQLS